MLTRTIAGPQGRLHVSADIDKSLSATPIIFLHADAGDLDHWKHIRAALADRPTVAFDRRGHGASDPPANGSYDHADSQNDIAAVADALGLQHFVLVAHSGGALSAYAFAGTHPARLAGLVLVDPPPDPSVMPQGLIEQTLIALRSEQYEQTVEQYYRSIAGADAKTVQIVLADLKATPRDTVIGAFAALATFDARAYAQEVPKPALSIIQPEFDMEGALHRIEPGFPSVAISDAGHWIHLAARDHFLRVLNEFLVTTPAGAQ